jgi:hypothetical protein
LYIYFIALFINTLQVLHRQNAIAVDLVRLGWLSLNVCATGQE